MKGVESVAGKLLVLLAAYLLGSLPTALIASRSVAGVDIRQIGDGNMGARNVTRTLGWGPGIFVAAADFSKGVLAILLARAFGLTPAWQRIAGIAVVLGHDFPVFARFRGGQGMAAILGTLFVLMPAETAGGLAMFLAIYLVAHNFDWSAGIGLGTVVLLALLFGQPPLLVGYAAALFVSIGVKKWWDWPKQQRLRSEFPESSQAGDAQPLDGTPR